MVYLVGELGSRLGALTTAVGDIGAVECGLGDVLVFDLHEVVFRFFIGGFLLKDQAAIIQHAVQPAQHGIGGAQLLLQLDRTAYLRQLPGIETRDVAVHQEGDEGLVAAIGDLRRQRLKVCRVTHPVGRRVQGHIAAVIVAHRHAPVVIAAHNHVDMVLDQEFRQVLAFDELDGISDQGLDSAFNLPVAAPSSLVQGDEDAGREVIVKARQVRVVRNLQPVAAEVTLEDVDDDVLADALHALQDQYRLSKLLGVLHHPSEPVQHVLVGRILAATQHFVDVGEDQRAVTGNWRIRGATEEVERTLPVLACLRQFGVVNNATVGNKRHAIVCPAVRPIHPEAEYRLPLKLTIVFAYNVRRVGVLKAHALRVDANVLVQ